MMNTSAMQASTGCKWAANSCAAPAESMSELRDNTGAGGPGLGSSNLEQWTKAGTSDRKAMIQEEVWNLEEG